MIDVGWVITVLTDHSEGAGRPGCPGLGLLDGLAEGRQFAGVHDDVEAGQRDREVLG